MLLALADDATGALEVGGELARRLGPVPVWFGQKPPGIPGGEAAIINTRSRHLRPNEAEARLRRAAVAVADRIFKKTDSTLRGNIAAEFRALIHAYPGRRIVYAPAFPDQGRTVRGGELFVHGQPLAGTAFAHDPLNPVRSGCIPDLLEESGVPVQAVTPSQLAAALDRSQDGGIIVCDGQENSDLAYAASILRDSRVATIAAGASVFAGYWAGAGDPLESQWPGTSRCLVVNGSLHPQSRRQVAWTTTAGWPLVQVGIPSEAGEAAHDSPGAGWTVLTTADSKQEEPLEVARSVGSMVRRILDARHYDTLVVIGGDTLDETLRALGLEWVESCGLMMPGVPVSRIEFAGRGITLITKAGGFGGDGMLGQIRERLEKSE
jgi:uncharacterized protein YgbK (DUF1537 family)